MRLITLFFLVAYLQLTLPSHSQTVEAINIQDVISANPQPLPFTLVGRAVPKLTYFGSRGIDETGNSTGSLIGTGFTHQWPGVYATARFKDDALIVAFDDDINRYRIAFNNGGTHLISRPGKQAFRFTRLGPGPHEVRLEKLSESQDGPGTFVGFFVPKGSALEPPPPQPRQIEFIGDSDMVGYGIASTERDCTAEEVFYSTDTQQTYARRIARYFRADYHVYAYSGIGMVRNHGGTTPHVNMRSLYPRVLYDSPVPFDVRNWRPQIVVLALGSNDFSPSVSAGEQWSDDEALSVDFRSRYFDFLSELRSRYPDAFFLLVAGKASQRWWTMFRPWWKSNAVHVAAIEAVVAAFRAKSDTRIDLVTYPYPENLGCHWHLNLLEHQAIANIIIRYIETRSELWQGQ